MNDELINSRTLSLIQSFLRKPAHSLILSGANGSGIDQLCTDITAQILGKTHAHNILDITPESGKSIGVEMIRELKRSLMTSAGKDDRIARVAVVHQAETMTNEAQNSLLKLIEEPSKNTLIVLMTLNTNMLLETVRSRCQIIKVLPITQQQAEAYAANHNFASADVKRAYLLSGGNASLFADLLEGENTEASDAVARAKSFVTAKPFERLIQQKTLSDSDSLKELLRNLTLIAEAGLHGNNDAARTRWKNMLVTTRRCQTLLKSSTPGKLVYLYLCTNL